MLRSCFQRISRYRVGRCCATAAAQQQREPTVSKPSVGVGVVILRHLKSNQNPEVLLIRRGKPPSKGLVSFPGGKQEIGETLIECAIRESMEETGAKLKYKDECLRVTLAQKANRIPKAFLNSNQLDHPVPFTAVDVISIKDEFLDSDQCDAESIRYHYAVIEVAATLEDPKQPLVAGDDADEAFWMDCGDLDKHDDIVPNLKSVVDLAVSSFRIPMTD
jgi:8-oxo-dGTP pyrophosphatase MutT (NUDIX family)